MRCGSMNCPRNEESLPKNLEHFFTTDVPAHVQFHPECCPLELDGMFCKEEHPEKNPYIKYSQLLWAGELCGFYKFVIENNQLKIIPFPKRSSVKSFSIPKEAF